jgi:chromosome segregation ATPase
MDLPKLEDLIRQSTEYNGFTLDYVRVADAQKLLEECQRLQRIEKMCQEKTEHIADQSEEIEQLTEEVEALQLDLAEAREAARWLASRVPDANARDWARSRWPWLGEELKHE